MFVPSRQLRYRLLTTEQHNRIRHDYTIVNGFSEREDRPTPHQRKKGASRRMTRHPPTAHSLSDDYWMVNDVVLPRGARVPADDGL